MMKQEIRFECQGSGKCCTSHGEYGFVYLKLKDRKNLAKHLKLSLQDFNKKYCDKTGNLWHLKERKDNPDCLFLKAKRCGVYEARPMQCRTWPFWPELMNAKSWNKDVVSFCPGVGKGPVWPIEKINEIVEQQKAWDLE
jgi:uncharacterized protein